MAWLFSRSKSRIEKLVEQNDIDGLIKLFWEIKPKDVEAKVSAIQALGKIGGSSDEAKRVLLSVSDNIIFSQEIRGAANSVLIQMGESIIRYLFADIYDHGSNSSIDTSIRNKDKEKILFIEAYNSLFKLEPSHIKLFIDYLQANNQPEHVKLVAIEILGSLGDRSAADALYERFENGEYYENVYAKIALIQLNDLRVLPKLISELTYVGNMGGSLGAPDPSSAARSIENLLKNNKDDKQTTGILLNKLRESDKHLKNNDIEEVKKYRYQYEKNAGVMARILDRCMADSEKTGDVLQLINLYLSK